jgi:hypothetical protein
MAQGDIETRELPEGICRPEPKDRSGLRQLQGIVPICFHGDLFYL